MLPVQPTDQLTSSSFIRHIAVFGSFWGLAEITLGTFLHLFHFPLAGLVLSQVAVLILLNAARIRYRSGSIIIMGLVAMLIKGIALSTIKLGPMVGILLESLTVELMFRRTLPGRGSFMITGMLVSILPIIQTLVVKMIYMGFTFIEYLVDFIQYLSTLFPFAAGWYLVLLYLMIHLTTGLLTGWLAWRLSEDIRLHRKAS